MRLFGFVARGTAQIGSGADVRVESTFTTSLSRFEITRLKEVIEKPSISVMQPMVAATAMRELVCVFWWSGRRKPLG